MFGGISWVIGFAREGDVMNGENGKQEPLVKGGSLNEKKSRIVSYTVPEIAVYAAVRGL